ncbi:MAG: hypothetical protein E6K82_21390 [Candidatus Rokuibacteriota bacterium]|nr:MAG: hypothetical protein E6K82_21390 [Candidatus Rokubacteria bacterium]
MTTSAVQRRSEVELFNALAEATDQRAIDEYRGRVLRCVLWLVARRPSGPLVVGDVGDIADEVITRLEEYLRPRGDDEPTRRFVGSNAQFRRYLYLTVGSVYADTVRLRLRLRSLDAPIETGDGETVPLGHLLDRLLEWPTAGEHLGRPDVQACVPIKEIARREGLRPNNVEVGLSRSRGAFRVAFLDVFFATADARFRARVDEAARRLSEPHGALFRAYWIHGRNPRETAASLGLGWDTAKALLGEAKEQVWRMLPEGGPA